MRRSSLSEAVERFACGTPQDIAFGEFLDHFYTSAHDARVAALSDEPALLCDARLDALVAAIAEHLSKAWLDRSAPGWAAVPCRFLAEPWFTATSLGPGLCEYLTYQSPAAFRRRNIVTDGAPLRRATTPRSKTHLGDTP